MLQVLPVADCNFLLLFITGRACLLRAVYFLCALATRTLALKSCRLYTHLSRPSTTVCKPVKAKKQVYDDVTEQI